MNRVSIGVVALGLFIVGSVSAGYANITQMKEYKKAFPGASTKCTTCHAVALPKKDGDHSMNAYGQKVKALAAQPTAENYKQAGQAA